MATDERGRPVELQLSDDQDLLRQTTQRFLADTCPLTEVRRLADRPGGFEPDWWAQGAELGWTSMLVPEALGGGSVSGAGLADLALVAEEMGRTVAPGPAGPGQRGGRRPGDVAPGHRVRPGHRRPDGRDGHRGLGPRPGPRCGVGVGPG